MFKRTQSVAGAYWYCWWTAGLFSRGPLTAVWPPWTTYLFKRMTVKWMEQYTWGSAEDGAKRDKTLHQSSSKTSGAWIICGDLRPQRILRFYMKFQYITLIIIHSIRINANTNLTKVYVSVVGFLDKSSVMLLVTFIHKELIGAQSHWLGI